MNAATNITALVMRVLTMLFAHQTALLLLWLMVETPADTVQLHCPEGPAGSAGQSMYGYNMMYPVLNLRTAASPMGSS
jgi:hypothetical protein